MSQTLSRLLGEGEGMIAKFIRQSEQLCGYPSEDIRLMASTANAAKAKIAQLGLDPADTTDQELYYALRAKAAKDSQLFRRQYSDSHLKSLFDYCEKSEKALALKKASAKRLLQSAPPKQLMKKLGYRSIDSMLKREDTAALFAAALKIESALWRQKFSRQLKKTPASDYQEQTIQLVVLPEKLHEPAARINGPVYLMGTVAISSFEAAKSGELNLMLNLIGYAEQLQGWSALAKEQQLSPNFTKFIGQYFNAEPGSQIGGLQVCFSNLANSYRSPIDKLAEISLPLAWWKENHYLGTLSSDKPVSLNLKDLLADIFEEKDFGRRQTVNFSQAFWHRLLQQYLAHPAFKNQVAETLQPEPALSKVDSDFSPFGNKSLAEVA